MMSPKVDAMVEQPSIGVTYSTRDMLTTLELRDAPGMLVEIDGQLSYIQDSHVTEDQLLSIPGLANQLWEYLYETSEWCPVFKYRGPDPITEFVDYEENRDSFGLEDHWWITPKGFPREQYD